MKLERERYVIMRNNRSEILCSEARELKFRNIDKIGKIQIKSYATKAFAEFGWYMFHCEPVDIVKVRETVEVIE